MTLIEKIKEMDKKEIEKSVESWKKNPERNDFIIIAYVIGMSIGIVVLLFLGVFGFLTEEITWETFGLITFACGLLTLFPVWIFSYRNKIKKIVGGNK